MRNLVSDYLKRTLSNGYTWAILAGGFSIGCGLLMQHNGVREFHYAGGGRFSNGQRQENGSSGMLYCLGGFILALALVRAILFRIDELKKFRAKDETKATLLPQGNQFRVPDHAGAHYTSHLRRNNLSGRMAALG